jgi:hypothetical protein
VYAQIDGIAQGAALVGRAPQWYFNTTTTINNSNSNSNSNSGTTAAAAAAAKTSMLQPQNSDAIAYIAGGIWPAARGLSDAVVQLK